MKKSLIVKLKLPPGRDISVKTTTQNQVDPNQSNTTQLSFADSMAINFPDKNGVINLGHLKDIYDALQQSSESADRTTASWIGSRYLYLPIQPGEVTRSVQSPDDFSKLFTAYKQSMKLTDSKKPEKWPFSKDEKKIGFSKAESNGGSLPGAMDQPKPEPGRETISLPKLTVVTDQRDAKESPEGLTGQDVAMTDPNQESVPETGRDSPKAIRVAPRITVATTALNAAATEKTPLTDRPLSRPQSVTGAGGTYAESSLTRFDSLDGMAPRLTAAHSDPITTNLDFLPPTATRKKRNSEPVVPNPNKKVKQNPTGPTRGRGRGRPRGSRGGNWRNGRNSEGREAIQAEGGTEPLPDAEPSNPLPDTPMLEVVEEGDGKESKVEKRVTRRTSSRLSNALARGTTPKLGTSVVQSDNKNENNSNGQVGKEEVVKANGNTFKEKVARARKLLRDSQVTAEAYRSQATVPIENPNETEGTATNPSRKASGVILEREPSVIRKRILDVFTPRPTAESRNKDIPIHPIGRSNNMPDKSMPPPATVQQSVPATPRAVSGNGADWNTTMGMSPKMTNGITMSDSSPGFLSDRRSELTSGGNNGVQNDVPIGKPSGISSGAASGIAKEVPTIELFARVHTAAGTTEVPVPTGHFVGDLDVIKRYGEWKQQEEGMSLTFDQFVKVFGFARKA